MGLIISESNYTPDANANTYEIIYIPQELQGVYKVWDPMLRSVYNLGIYRYRHRQTLN